MEKTLINEENKSNFQIKVKPSESLLYIMKQKNFYHAIVKHQTLIDRLLF